MTIVLLAVTGWTVLRCPLCNETFELIILFLLKRLSDLVCDTFVGD